jgi:hypothetical protein
MSYYVWAYPAYLKAQQAEAGGNLVVIFPTPPAPIHIHSDQRYELRIHPIDWQSPNLFESRNLLVTGVQLLRK